MSQINNAVNFLIERKRAYRKRQPLSDSENRWRLLRERDTHKEINVFIRNQLKDDLIELCNRDGLTQAQIIEKITRKKFKAQGLLK
jgi:allophanate hydrolase subunit 1